LLRADYSKQARGDAEGKGDSKDWRKGRKREWRVARQRREENGKYKLRARQRKHTQRNKERKDVRK
jgi:hypothetical protein